MKLGSFATKPLALLAGVLEQYDSKLSKPLLEANHEGIGLNLKAKLFPAVGEIKKAEPESTIGWFGYEADPPRGPRLFIWWYFNDAPMDLQGRAHDWIRKQGRAAGFPAARVQINGGDIGLFCKADESDGDLEWFERALDAFGK
jgi:hypothetical protein